GWSSQTVRSHCRGVVVQFFVSTRSSVAPVRTKMKRRSRSRDGRIFRRPPVTIAFKLRSYDVQRALAFISDLGKSKRYTLVGPPTRVTNQMRLLSSPWVSTTIAPGL